MYCQQQMVEKLFYDLEMAAVKGFLFVLSCCLDGIFLNKNSEMLEFCEVMKRNFHLFMVPASRRGLLKG